MYVYIEKKSEDNFFFWQPLLMNNCVMHLYWFTQYTGRGGQACRIKIWRKNMTHLHFVGVQTVYYIQGRNDLFYRSKGGGKRKRTRVYWLYLYVVVVRVKLPLAERPLPLATGRHDRQTARRPNVSPGLCSSFPTRSSSQFRGHCF